MKRIFNVIAVAVTVAASLAGCKTDTTAYDDKPIKGVSALVAPADGYTATMYDVSAANLVFEWEHADFIGAPTYEVVFYSTPGGEEVYRLLSDRQGQSNSVVVSHAELSRIVGIAGVAPGTTGDVYWTVSTSMGSRREIASATRKLTVIRYSGIEDVPARLFITGTAGEDGGDTASAQQFRQVSAGVFETYTSLKSSGDFMFVNRNEAGDHRSFSVEEGVLVENGTASTVPADGVYRVTADFGTGVATIESIDRVWFINPSATDQNEDMDYIGGGVWEITDKTLIFGDDRYSFRATVDGEEEVWGSSKADNNAPSTLSGSYFDIVPRPREGLRDDWSHTYKFMAAVRNMTALSIRVDMSAAAESYIHTLDFGELTAVGANPASPADGVEVQLNNRPTSAVGFSWTAGDGAGTNSTYRVVFFSGADSAEPLGSIASGNNGFETSADVSHAALESFATAAGIASGGTGTIYWAVQTTLITESTMSERRAMNVTRIQGIPEHLYMTGGGTEYASLPKEMKNIGTGRFEIYSKLTSGTDFYFVDAPGGNSSTYYIDAAGTLITNSPGFDVVSENPYRIVLDFSNETAVIEEITKVEMRMVNDARIQMPYQADGVWFAADALANWNTGWEDDRFYFNVTIGGEVEKYGSNTGNFNNGASYDVKVAEGAEPYWVYVNGDRSDHDWGWKVWSGYRGATAEQNKRMDVKLNLSSSAEHYYVYLNYLN